MTNATKDRPFQRWNPDTIPVPLAAGANIFYGTIVALNADGLGVPGAESAGLIYAGAAKSSVDNSDGGDGDKVVHVQRSANNAIKWVNDGSIGQEHLLKVAYILDNQTVTATDGDGVRSAIGLVVRIEPDGVWIQ